MMKNYYARLCAISCLLLGSAQLSAQNFTLSTFTSNFSCVGGCEGFIDLSVSGGMPPSVYTYTWVSGATTQAIFGLCPGTYTVTVTDANGFTKTASATVASPPQMYLYTYAAGCTQTVTEVVTQPTAIILSASVTNSSNGTPIAGFRQLTFLSMDWAANQTQQN